MAEESVAPHEIGDDLSRLVRAISDQQGNTDDGAGDAPYHHLPTRLD